jgi:hypothetical protein
LFLRHYSSSILSRHYLSVKAHRHSNIMFTAANHRSLCRARWMQSTTSTHKSVLGKCICEFGRQEITENRYVLNFVTLFSVLIWHMHILDLVIMVCKFCRCSFQQWKTTTRWTYCGWKTGKHWTLPSSGKVIELLLNRTTSFMIWNKNIYVNLSK